MICDVYTVIHLNLLTHGCVARFHLHSLRFHFLTAIYLLVHVAQSSFRLSSVIVYSTLPRSLGHASSRQQQRSVPFFLFLNKPSLNHGIHSRRSLILYSVICYQNHSDFTVSLTLVYMILDDCFYQLV